MISHLSGYSMFLNLMISKLSCTDQIYYFKFQQSHQTRKRQILCVGRHDKKEKKTYRMNLTKRHLICALGLCLPLFFYYVKNKATTCVHSMWSASLLKRQYISRPSTMSSIYFEIAYGFFKQLSMSSLPKNFKRNSSNFLSI